MKTEISVFKIKKIVSEYYGVKTELLSQKTREKCIVKARSVFCYLSNEFTNLSLEKIGSEISRDHSTISFSINKIKIEKEIYKDLKNDIEKITEKLLIPACVISEVDLLEIAKLNSKCNDYLF